MALPKIKICCISSKAEALRAIDAGAAAIGLVGGMPSGPGIITDSMIREIAAATPPPIATFLLTSYVETEDIVAHAHATCTNTIQIVDHISLLAYPGIRKSLPGVKIVQVVHILDETSIAEALAYAEVADTLLLDSGNPKLGVKVLGGTGQIHDWALSRKIVEQSPIPVFLAGGLNAENVADAIQTVAPFGLDLCSGVRTAGNLDPWKLEAFFRAAGY
jgi:phosphoribosylanthranilate isomerase